MIVCPVLRESGQSVQVVLQTDRGQSVQGEVLKQTGEIVHCEELTESEKSMWY